MQSYSYVNIYLSIRYFQIETIKARPTKYDRQSAHRTTCYTVLRVNRTTLHETADNCKWEKKSMNFLWI